jgi:hypothetical protein
MHKLQLNGQMVRAFMYFPAVRKAKSTIKAGNIGQFLGLAKLVGQAILRLVAEGTGGAESATVRSLQGVQLHRLQRRPFWGALHSRGSGSSQRQLFAPVFERIKIDSGEESINLRAIDSLLGASADCFI